MEPNKVGAWDFRSFTFSPDQIVVNQGDKVTLHFRGVQGAHHLITVDGLSPLPTSERTNPHCLIHCKQPRNHKLYLPRTLAKHGWPNIVSPKQYQNNKNRIDPFFSFSSFIRLRRESSLFPSLFLML